MEFYYAAKLDLILDSNPWQEGPVQRACGAFKTAYK